MTHALFPKLDLRIARLTPADGRRETDVLRDFKMLVMQSEDMYPGIRRWLEQKVVPGLRSSERVLFVGYSGEQAVASAVVKLRHDAKFCHLKIREDLQDRNLGEALFSLMALEVRHQATEVHFTLPESLWEREQGFFKSFGFMEASPASAQYRLFDQELHCQTSFPQLWQAVLRRIPRLVGLFELSGFSMDNRLLLSIRPAFAKSILSGNKAVEIRRRFSTKWTGARITLYATRPQSALVGEATISRIATGNAATLWKEFGPLSGCSEAEYRTYVAGAEEVSWLFLDDIRPFLSPIPLAQLNHLMVGSLRPPQSYAVVSADEPWGRALALASMLHGRFSPARRSALPLTISTPVGDGASR